MKSWLQDNDIEMYLTQNEEKFVVAERFIRTLMKKFYKYMTSKSKNVYIDKSDDIVDEYNNTYQNTIKMKPADVKSSTYIENEKITRKLQFEVADHVRISKFYISNWPENFL